MGKGALHGVRLRTATYLVQGFCGADPSFGLCQTKELQSAPAISFKRIH